MFDVVFLMSSWLLKNKKLENMWPQLRGRRKARGEEKQQEEKEQEHEINEKKKEEDKQTQEQKDSLFLQFSEAIF